MAGLSWLPWLQSAWSIERRKVHRGQATRVCQTVVGDDKKRTVVVNIRVTSAAVICR